MTWGVEADVSERFRAAGVPAEQISLARDAYVFDFPGTPSEFSPSSRLLRADDERLRSAAPANCKRGRATPPNSTSSSTIRTRAPKIARRRSRRRSFGSPSRSEHRDRGELRSASTWRALRSCGAFGRTGLPAGVLADGQAAARGRGGGQVLRRPVGGRCLRAGRSLRITVQTTVNVSAETLPAGGASRDVA